VAVSSIGIVISGASEPKFLDAQGRNVPLAHLAYSHF